MTTLREALKIAHAYWDTKGGSTGTVMTMRARKCITLGGLSWDRPVSSLTAKDATAVLTGIRGLALSSRATYYTAFKRMVCLAGGSVVGWPAAGSVPRRVREPMLREDAVRLGQWFAVNDMPETRDLLTVLMGTGMRVECEALGWDWLPMRSEAGFEGVWIKGKGGHERVVPAAHTLGDILGEPLRANPMRRLSYSAHLKRWNAGVKALGIATRLPTPHAVRHLYATEAYQRSGRNLHVVKELLGHADINTTARYIGVDMEELRHAAGA